MDKIHLATRNGEDQKVISLCKEKLLNDPDDISSHFSLAMAYENIAEYELALEHVNKCLSKMPDYFDCLVLASRCLCNQKHYENAYEYAQKALKDDGPQGFPDLAQKIFKLMSYLPRLKSLRNINEDTINNYQKQKEWLQDYVEWYENKNSPNNSN